MKWGARGGIEKKAFRAWLKKLRAVWRCQSGPGTQAPPPRACSWPPERGDMTLHHCSGPKVGEEISLKHP